MMRINAPIFHASHAMGYYLEGKGSLGDYYQFGLDDTTGFWFGKTAQQLGLTGAIQREDFEHMCDNINPQTGSMLTGRHNVNRRVGRDVTFSVPKDVSLAWAVNQDQEIITALQQAVATTLERAEQDAQVRVRKGGADHDRISGNMAAAIFTHHTSRPTEASPIPDPQLHVHALVFNCSHDPVEDQMKALQMGRIHRDAPYFQAIFMSELAANLRQLGYAIERRGSAWGLKGFDRDLVERFSHRALEIDRKADELGITDPNEKAKLGATTRQAKAKELEPERMREQWLSRLDKSEQAVLRHLKEFSQEPDVLPRQALEHGHEHLYSKHSVIRSRDLFTEALDFGVGHMRIGDVEKTFNPDHYLRHNNEEGDLQITTQKILEEETELIRWARQGLSSCTPMADPDRVIEPDPETGHTLNEDQEAAVRDIWASRHRVTLVRGVAGAGKTTLFKQVKAGIEAHGQYVLALAPSTQASRNVLRQEGFAGAETVAMALKSHDLQKKAKGQVILVDEASMLGTREMNQVFNLAERLNARLILCGDSKQHSSPTRGEALRLLEEHANIPTIQVQKIMRQSGKYREAVEYLSRGQGAKGFDMLDQMGAIVELDNETRHQQLAVDYVTALAKKESPLVVCPTHREGWAVTEEIRSALKEFGTIQGPEHAVESVHNLHWSEANKRDKHRYEPGQKAFFNTAAKGVRAGQWLTIVGQHNGDVYGLTHHGKPVPLPLHQSERFSVYDTRQINLAKGDKVRFTHNVKTEYGRRINNGSDYRFENYDQKNKMLIFKQPDGKGQPFRIHDRVRFITHGYCNTSPSAQSRSEDPALVAQGAESFKASSLEQFYVSVSRGKNQIKVYTDDKERLRAHVIKSSERTTATEMVAQEPALNNLYKRIQYEQFQDINRKRQHELAPRQTRDKMRSMSRGALRHLQRTRGLSIER